MPRRNGKQSKPRASKNKIVTNNVVVAKPTIGRMPRNVQLFPDELFTTCKVMIPGQLSGATNTTWTFHGNGAGYKYGPQVNYTGVFNIESPAGLLYLLSTATSSGSTSPYTRMWTYKSEIEVQFINYGTIPVECSLLASTQGSFSGSNSSQLAEQPNAISRIYPPITSTTQSIHACFDWPAIFGVSQKTYLSDLGYAQGSQGLPAQLVFWHIQWASTDNTTNFLGSVKIVVRHHIKLAGLQQFTSADPTMKDDNTAVGLEMPPLKRFKEDSKDEVVHINSCDCNKLDCPLCVYFSKDKLLKQLSSDKPTTMSGL
jgi:hypothetical protein